jgi:hypothetical protein
MKHLWSDRLWILKPAAAILCFSWLGHRAAADFGRLYPSADRLAVDAERLEGKTVTLSARPVLGPAPDGFDVATYVGPMRVVAAERPPSGARVSVLGRAAGTRRIEAVRVQVNEGWAWKRPLNYAVSTATLLVFLWLIRGRFRSRLSEGLFRSRC